jgi:hypothetical protein
VATILLEHAKSLTCGVCARADGRQHFDSSCIPPGSTATNRHGCGGVPMDRPYGQPQQHHTSQVDRRQTSGDTQYKGCNWERTLLATNSSCAAQGRCGIAHLAPAAAPSGCRPAHDFIGSRERRRMQADHVAANQSIQAHPHTTKAGWRAPTATAVNHSSKPPAALQALQLAWQSMQLRPTTVTPQVV